MNEVRVRWAWAAICMASRGAAGAEAILAAAERATPDEAAVGAKLRTLCSGHRLCYSPCRNPSSLMACMD